MSTLLWSFEREGVPSDQNTVRNTATPVEHDAPPAEQSHSPMPQDVQTDSNPDLGMVTRQLASDWHESVQYTPEWLANASDQSKFEKVNEQVASSGTAAAREAAGIFGHGTMAYAVGIEPVGDLVPGGKLGNDYFVTHPREMQSTMSNQMSVPPGSDRDTNSSVSAQGKQDARAAAVAAMYKQFYTNMVGQ